MSNPNDPYDGTPGSPDEGGPGTQPPPPPPPYGGPDQGGQAPGYGQPSYGQAPYEQSPYASTGYPDDAPKSTDPVSIIGFILSLTCCLSIVGAIMGAFGLRRTKDGQRRGRWAAVSALIIGVLGTLAFIGIIVAVVFVANSVIGVDQAKVGQCANISNEDRESVLLTDTSCEDAHDAEIVYTGTYSQVESSQFVPSDSDDLTDAGISFGICTELMTNNGQDADLEALGDDVEYQFVTETSDPAADEPFYCYVERTDGNKFTEKRLP
ncbi:MAG: DUF4190 domain-containing protein [Nocardioides sp.]